MPVSCSLEVTHCPLCQQPRANSVPFNRCRELGVDWRYHMCRNCGLVYQSPQMNDQELASYYAAEYWKLQGQDRAPDDDQAVLQSTRARNLTELVPADFRVHRFLDIGCAGGYLLREAAKRFDADVVGVELSDSFRQHCQSQGFRVYASTEALADANEARFDCISMSHVLEHIRQPVEFLERLRTSLLSPAGLLLLEVPNLYAHRSFEPAHPICFSEKTLAATLARAGFEMRSLRVHSEPRPEVNRPLYLTALAAPVPAGSKSRQVRFDPPNPWLERVKRAYISKRGAWWRRALKGIRIGAVSLFQSDLQY
jgi:2-polyprenyl-3-methyl-5-hydroxy-6-metoxy-1,4-benzoquinol methylase